MSWPDDFTVALLGACAQRALDGARAATPHVRTGLRRIREAVGSGTLTVGPVSVALSRPAATPSRIVTGHISTRRGDGGGAS